MFKNSCQCRRDPHGPSDRKGIYVRFVRARPGYALELKILSKWLSDRMDIHVRFVRARALGNSAPACR